MALAGLSMGHAQPVSTPPDPAVLQLGGLSADDAAGMAANLCSQRVPDSRADWAETSRQWHGQHGGKLAALKQSSRALEAALKAKAGQDAPLDLGQYTMLLAQGPTLILYGLAGANDAKARELCESFRARLLDRQKIDASLDETQAAASAVLGTLSRR